MSQPVGDLVIDLSLDAVRFDEQMSRVSVIFRSGYRRQKNRQCC